MALLFFVDHLMLKGGQRTIHDLSCQFGARGFTEEMRQAVGTTQEGLTEFLAQFPSLFILDGDQVVLKGFGEVEGKNHLMHLPATGRQRDYVAEAVQFFVRKLEKFGPELQIKSLLGHRSQAAPEVRLVSGRHLKEFADFLAAQKDFVVEGDRVRLRNMPEPKAAKPEEFVDEEGRPLAGHKAKLAAIQYMTSVLEQNEDHPIPLDNFYKRFCDRFPHHIRQEVATNPKELLMFLKLNRHIFFIRSNKVQLVRSKPGDELGSESGRSTEDSVASEEGTRNAAASPDGIAGSGGGASQQQQQAASTLLLRPSSTTMFPLNMENLERIHLIKTMKQAQESVSILRADLDSMASSTDNLNNFLAFDFKLVNIGSSPHQEQFIALIVVCHPAGSQQRISIFDLAHSEGILLDSGLSGLLESDKMLKVVHDLRRVTPVLSHRYGIRMRNVFDTQIAHSVIQHQKFNKPMGELRAISFVNLQRVYDPQSLVLSDVNPRKLSQTPNWADRPISSELLLSACQECHCLANGLYRLLQAQLAPQHLSLLNQLTTDALAAVASHHGRGEQQQTQQTNTTTTMTTTALLKNGTLIASETGMAAASGSGGGGIVVQQQQQSLMERKVTPLMELPMNGIYRPPGSRRQSLLTGQQQQPAPPPMSLAAFHSSYVPPPLRKVSAPPVQQPPPQPPTLQKQRSTGTATGHVISNCGTTTTATIPLASSAAFHHQCCRTSSPPSLLPIRAVQTCEAETQTISTGEIAVLKVYYEDEAEMLRK